MELGEIPVQEYSNQVPGLWPGQSESSPTNKQTNSQVDVNISTWVHQSEGATRLLIAPNPYSY